ncbi:aldo/keto reductase [Rhizophagus clarus]|uniref:Aldo/keto reductase n=1 Tax=Rhizophagus clarus TaxID=94130 RepID=A0A8H3LT88_9GLOM|nr:aldo/keto reductase [Rhizophagus clarus]
MKCLFHKVWYSSRLRSECKFVGVSKVSGKPEYVRKACDASLKRLGIDCIDLVKEGKIKYIGLSECSAASAHKVHPIAVVQVNIHIHVFFLIKKKNALTLCFIRSMIVLGLLILKETTCKELGITIVAFSALGRGFLTGIYRSFDDFEPDDIRRYHPRFQPENLAKNLELADKFSEFASKRGVTAGQLCLAWVLAQSDNIVVIPGTKKIKYLEENIAAAKVQLSSEELSEVREIINSLCYW